MSNKKIGFYFEDQLPNISTPLLDDFSFFMLKMKEIKRFQKKANY